MTYENKWWDESLNPIRGCSKISPGCNNCYAYEMILRGGQNPHRIIFNGDHLTKQQKWKKSRKIFNVSMSDMFHQAVPFEYIDLIFFNMRINPQHTYFILTKRPDRMREYCKKYYQKHNNFPKCVWLGVTAEDQQRANERVPILLDTIAYNHFVSVEPMLEPVKLLFEAKRKLKWVICGGEKILNPIHKNKIRIIDPAWARNLRAQCSAHNVPFFMKQMNIFPDRSIDIPPDLYLKQFPISLM